MTADEHKDAVKAAFSRDPRRLVDALMLRIDEHKSKASSECMLWVYDGNETDASLLVGSKDPAKYGLCHRFGDDWSGDCFGLVQRYRPHDGFRTRLEFVSRLYGIEPPERYTRPDKTQAPAVHVVSDTRYPVINEDGEVLAVHHRQDFADGSKRIWWEDADGKPGTPDGVTLTELPLWRSWELSRKPGKAVVLCEGEKDCDALHSVGALAVGTYGADVVPSAEVLCVLSGRTVYLWPDNDAPGERHMAAIADRLQGIAGSIRQVRWEDAPPKGGAADWFAAGHDAAGTKALLQAAEPWEPIDLATVEQAVGTIPYAPLAGMVLKGAVPVADIAAEIIERAEAYRLMPRQLYGLRFGWDTLDWHYGGFRFEGLITISGATGRGKTTVARHGLFATADAILAEGSDARMLFYALEGGSEQLWRYWAGWKYGVPKQLLRPGSESYMTDAWANVMQHAYSRFPLLPVDICTGTRDAEAILCDVERRAATGPIECVVIDNLQLLEYPIGCNAYEYGKRAAIRCLDIADIMKFPIIVLTQINQDRGGFKERGGPDWGNAATCKFHVERGESGISELDRNHSNRTILHNTKARNDDPCKPLNLIGNRDTRRLWEEDAPRETDARVPEDQEADPWHSN